MPFSDSSLVSSWQLRASSWSDTFPYVMWRVLFKANKASDVHSDVVLNKKCNVWPTPIDRCAAYFQRNKDVLWNKHNLCRHKKGGKAVSAPSSPLLTTLTVKPQKNKNKTLQEYTTRGTVYSDRVMALYLLLCSLSLRSILRSFQSRSNHLLIWS